MHGNSLHSNGELIQPTRPFSIWTSPHLSGSLMLFHPWLTPLSPHWPLADLQNHQASICTCCPSSWNVLPAHNCMTHSLTSFRSLPTFCHHTYLFPGSPLKKLQLISIPIPNTQYPPFFFIFSPMLYHHFCLFLFLQLHSPDHGSCSLNTRRENKWTVEVCGCWGWLG